jgi:hypothetical protein
MTYDRYSHVLPDNLAQVAADFDRYLDGPNLGHRDPGSVGLSRSQSGLGSQEPEAGAAAETAA